MDPEKSLEALRKLRVVDLKERLLKEGKSTSGLKADLLDRLYKTYQEQIGNVDMMDSGGEGSQTYSQSGDDMSEMAPLHSVSEPPVVEVTIDTSQFDCGVEPQIVTIGSYVMDNEQEVSVQNLHMEQVNREVYYNEPERGLDEEEIQRRWLEQENIRHQQEETERMRQQQLEELEARRQQEDAEFERQQSELEIYRLQQEHEAERLRQEEEYRILQEQAEFRRVQEELQRKEAERLELYRLQEEQGERRRLEEAERQRMEEAHRIQQAEILRQQEARRLQELAEQRRIEEEAELQRHQLAEAEQRRKLEELRYQQEQADLRLQEAERQERERLELYRQQQQRAEEEETRRLQEAEALRLEQEREQIRIREEEELQRQESERLELYRQQQEILQQESEAKRLLQEQEELRLQREQEALRLQQEQEALRLHQEQEALQLQREQEALQIQRDQEALRLQQEQEALRLQQEQEALRLQQEQEALRRQQEQEALRRQQEQEALRLQQEQEALRLQQEQEALQLKQEQEALRLKEEQEEILLQQQQKAELQRMRAAVEAAEKEREIQRRIQEEQERQRRLRDEEERIRKQREADDKQRRERELERQMQIAAENAGRPSVTEGGPPPSQFPPPGMGQKWVPPGYQGPESGTPRHSSEGMFGAQGHQYQPSGDSPPPSSSPPPIPGLGPPSPSSLAGGLPPALMSLDITNPEDEMPDEEMRLPHALEKALAFKTERAQQLGVDPDTIDSVSLDAVADEEGGEDDGTEMDDSHSAVDAITVAAKPNEPRPSKNKRRKMKKKKRAGHRRNEEQIREFRMDEETGEDDVTPDVEVQYIEDNLELNPSDPMYHHFMKIFQAFKLTDPEVAKREAEEEANRLKLESQKQPDLRKKPKDADEEPEEDTKKETHPKLSKRKMKKLNRLSIAELKQHVSRPDVVEMHDVTAKDPKLLVLLKSTRNTVPVPRHWCFKRKYLQGKRGIEKPPFDLPEFIKKTGIMEMRQALQEKEDQKTLKAKMRERVRPKLGKIDIDYQKLHDAFFKWQTKPRMTIHGDLYYEGKEFETRLKEKKPGELSDDLRTALGMPVGPNSQKIPSPWLIAMQRYGPPPSYPSLKIPGLNSPIPDSCSFGYHAGGWGKPPVDEMGKPLYGDVFGMQGGDYQQPLPEEEIDRTLWGELESESESESDEEEDEDEDDEEMEAEEPDKGGLATPADGGLVTPSGITSIPMGMETPDMIELRKRKIENEMEGGETPALYTILPEKKMDRLGPAMMGSTHIYDIAAAMPGRARLGGANAQEGGVEVALDPSELDLDAATMTARYEQTLREQQNQLEKEDLSDMVAEHSAKQKSKRKRAAGQQDAGRAVKKYKDFKF